MATGDVNNAATILVRAYAPSRLFPLVGATYSGTTQRADRANVRELVAPTYVWNGGPTDAPWGNVLHNQSDEQSLFPKQVFSGAVRVMLNPIGSPGMVLRAVMTRQWNGIGGVGYVPSFPQLDRHNTTWPHAS